MERTSAEDNAIDRRAAIKKGIAGAAAAGLVWSAPRIEGLSLRPNYAAAQSGIPLTAALLFNLSNLAPGSGPSTDVTCGSGTLTATGILTSESVLVGTWTFNPGAAGTVTSVDGASSPSPAVDWAGGVSGSGVAGDWSLMPSSFSASPGPEVAVTLKFLCT